MTKLIDIRQIGITILRYGLAALAVWFLASKGLHPAWGVLLIIYRKAAFRILIAFGLFYWITSSIM